MLIGDALAISVGLDPRAFNKGSTEVRNSLRKTREDAKKDATSIEGAMDKAAESVNRLSRNALKLYAIFTGGRAVKDFVSDITGADAALGRLAQRIGQAPSDISAMASAVQRTGGSFDAASQSFQSFSDSIQELKATGNTSILPFLYRVQAAGGKQINLNRDISATFIDLADNLKTINDTQGAATANYYGKQLGLDPGTVALMVQGGDAMRRRLEQSKRLGIASKADAEAAARLQEAWRSLTQASEGLGRSIMTALSPALTDILGKMQLWFEKNGQWLRAEINSKVTKLVEIIKPIARVINNIVEATVGWQVAIEALVATAAFGKLLTLLRLISVVTGGGGKGIFGRAGAAVVGALGVGGTAAVAAAVGTAVGADKAVKNKDKPALTNNWDDEASGAAGGAGAWGAIKRAYRYGRRAIAGDQSNGVAANPGAYKDVLDHIARSEGTASQPGGGYNTSLGYGRYLPGGKEQKLTSMTLDQILALGIHMRGQPGNPSSSALGRYQIVGNTLKVQMRKLGLKGSDLFDEKTQDRIAANLARQRGADPAGLRNEWASLVGEKNRRAVELMQRIDPRSSTMPLDRPQNDIPAGRRPEVLADPKDPRRIGGSSGVKPSAWNGYPGASDAIAAAHLAQAANVTNRTTNDNRRMSSSETNFSGGIHVTVPGGNANDIAGELQDAVRRRSFAVAANYGQA